MFSFNKSLRQNRTLSTSLQDISSVSIVEEQPKCSKAISEFNIPKLRKSKKYDHVESKVKQYRMEIKRQQRESRRKRKVQKALETKLEKNDSLHIKNNENNDDAVITVESLSNKLNEQERIAREKQHAIAILEKQNRDLLKQVADLQIRLDQFRMELCHPKSPPATVRHVPRYVSSSTLLNNLQSPLKMIGDALRTPIRNVSGSVIRNFSWSNAKNAPKPADNSSVSDADELDCSVFDSNSFFITSPKPSSSEYNKPETVNMVADSQKIKRNKSIMSKVRRSLDRVASIFRRKSSTGSEASTLRSKDNNNDDKRCITVVENQNVTSRTPLIQINNASSSTGVGENE